MTPLWLLRHGDTATGPMIIGQRDVPLSPAALSEWRQQYCPATKNIIATVDNVCIHSSDLQRCAVPAAALGALRPDACLRPDALLREQSFGTWEGRAWADIPEARRVLADPLHLNPPSGESYQQVITRVRAWIATLDRDQPALVIAHAGSLRAILAIYLGLPPARAQDLAWKHWDLTRIDRYCDISGTEHRGVLVFHQRGFSPLIHSV